MPADTNNNKTTMVVQPWQDRATGLAVAALCALAYLLSFELMDWLPAGLQYAPGVALFFLPAGVKLVALLVARAWGLLGIAAAGVWTAADVWQSAGWLALLGNVVVWVGVPYLVIHLMLRWMKIHADLSNLSYLKVMAICLAAILATSVAGTAYAVWAHGQPLADLWARAVAMALGDFLGAGVVFALLIGVLNLLQAGRALDH
jgi:hypothetical protein